jgi:hypothetical protein
MKRKSVRPPKRADASPPTPVPASAPAPTTATPPAKPQPPMSGGWPIYKLGESYVVGGRYPKPGTPPVLRKVEHDPDGILSGKMDAPSEWGGRGRTAVERSFDRPTADLYRNSKGFCPY